MTNVLVLFVSISLFLNVIDALTIHLCGVDTSYKFQCIEVVDGVLGTWVEQTGGGERVAVDGNTIITSNHEEVIYFKTIGATTWTHRGIIHHLSSYNNVVCGFNDIRLGLLMCADVVNHANPSWYILSFMPWYATRKLHALSGIKATLKKYYIPIEGSIHSQVAAGDEATKLLIQISYDGSTLCGVTASKEAYCATQGLPDYPIFVQIPGNDFEYISVQLDTIFAVRAENAVYQTTNPATTWTDLNKILTCIDTSHVI